MEDVEHSLAANRHQLERAVTLPRSVQDLATLLTSTAPSNSARSPFPPPRRPVPPLVVQWAL
jgi:hypothetical protein